VPVLVLLEGLLDRDRSDHDRLGLRPRTLLERLAARLGERDPMAQPAGGLGRAGEDKALAP
jgi:hypothetical protein